MTGGGDAIVVEENAHAFDCAADPTSSSGFHIGSGASSSTNTTGGCYRV